MPSSLNTESNQEDSESEESKDEENSRSDSSSSDEKTKGSAKIPPKMEKTGTPPSNPNLMKK